MENLYNVINQVDISILIKCTQGTRQVRADTLQQEVDSALRRTRR